MGDREDSTVIRERIKDATNKGGRIVGSSLAGSEWQQVHQRAMWGLEYHPDALTQNMLGSMTWVVDVVTHDLTVPVLAGFEKMLWDQAPRGNRRWCDELRERPMSRPRYDLGKSPVVLNRETTAIAMIELSLSRWVVGGMVPGITRDPVKKLGPDPEGLLKLLLCRQSVFTAITKAIVRGLEPAQGFLSFAICWAESLLDPGLSFAAAQIFQYVTLRTAASGVCARAESGFHLLVERCNAYYQCHN